MTPILKSLRWLSLLIICKILLVNYKVLYGFGPAYLNEVLFYYTPHYG